MSSTLLSSQTVFDPAGSGYHTFRIPAIVAADDHLLAFCEGRLHSPADAGEIEVVLRRSTDGGRSWQPPQVVSSDPGKTCGNPVPMVDPASGDIVLVTTRNGADVNEDVMTRGADPENGRRVYVQRSSDRGVTWTTPEEITRQIKPSDWGWYATGPCHGIALTSEPHAGRLLVPANHSLLPKTKRPVEELVWLNGAHCIWSDDGGHSWQLGFVDRNDDGVINANENAAVELSDGRIYFNARNHKGTGSARVHTYSTDGGESVTDPYAEIPEVTAPGIQGSLLRVGDRLLLSTPADAEKRRRLTIYVSDDSGATWRTGSVVHPQPSGYSDLVGLPDGTVGLLYEAGDTEDSSSFQTLRFVTLDPSAL